jgi:hypothetical protein
MGIVLIMLSNHQGSVGDHPSSSKDLSRSPNKVTHRADAEGALPAPTKDEHACKAVACDALVVERLAQHACLWQPMQPSRIKEPRVAKPAALTGARAAAMHDLVWWAAAARRFDSAHHVPSSHPWRRQHNTESCELQGCAPKGLGLQAEGNRLQLSGSGAAESDQQMRGEVGGDCANHVSANDCRSAAMATLRHVRGAEG